MAVKTITIDLEAYALLARHKRKGESFSQVIKARFGPQPTAKAFLQHVRAIRLEASTMDAMDRLVRARRREPVRIIKL